MIFLAILILFALFLGFCYYENNKIDVSYYNIKSKDATKNFKIVHLSDFHSKPFKKVLERTQKEKPQIICITGDYVNDHCKNKDKMLEYARQLIKIAPVYYITGNHERRLDNFNELMKELQAAGFNVLLNECIESCYTSFMDLHNFMFTAVYTNPVCKGEEKKAVNMLINIYNYYIGHIDEMPEEYINIAQSDGEERAVCDYIAGMSDTYALKIFNKLFVPMFWYD